MYLRFTNQNSIKHFVVSIRRQAKKSISRFSYYAHQVLNAGFTRACIDWRTFRVLRHFLFDANLEMHSGPYILNMATLNRGREEKIAI